jgi:hypothetical protein
MSHVHLCNDVLARVRCVFKQRTPFFEENNPYNFGLVFFVVVVAVSTIDAVLARQPSEVLSSPERWYHQRRQEVP